MHLSLSPFLFLDFQSILVILRSWNTFTILLLFVLVSVAQMDIEYSKTLSAAHALHELSLVSPSQMNREYSSTIPAATISMNSSDVPRRRKSSLISDHSPFMGMEEKELAAVREQLKQALNRLVQREKELAEVREQLKQVENALAQKNELVDVLKVLIQSQERVIRLMSEANGTLKKVVETQSVASNHCEQGSSDGRAEQNQPSQQTSSECADIEEFMQSRECALLNKTRNIPWYFIFILDDAGSITFAPARCECLTQYHRHSLIIVVLQPANQ